MSKELTPSMRRSVLIAALRDKGLWPAGFKWDFSHCKGCAIAIAERLSIARDIADIRRPLGIPETHIVFGSWGYPGYEDDEITPAMVADRLEAVHRELEGVS